ncbi:restriction endonuclease subunit S [Methylobacter sp. Wu8]|uniref:restriction endonuclease subunit S n=1 Tax=Methylobacter sp. Wu8 TaxID=3118457 RepID=UPI002F2F6A87
MLIDIRPDHLQIVQEILQRHVPQYAVWAFGSRAKWTAKDYSDLDLCVVSDKALDFRVLGALTEDFSESDLPYKVDVVDWATTSESFRKIIEQDKVVIQKEQQTQISHVGRVSPSGVTRQAVDAPANEDVGLHYVNPTYAAYRIDQLIEKNLLEIGDGYRAKNSELSNTGIPFARAANINNGFKFNNADFFPEADLAKVGNKISKPGDVVFTSKGTVGRFALVDLKTPRFVYSPQLCFWRSLDKKEILPEYLYYWMSSQEFLNQIGYLKGQTDMADYVSLRDQRKITATIPNIDVQQQVASVLKPIDDRIVLLRETNATLEAIAQALFKSWFVDFDPVRAKQQGREPEGAVQGCTSATEGRMPVAALDAETAALFPDSFEESELGLVPKGWRAGNIGDNTVYLSRGISPKYLEEGGVLVVNQKCIRDFILDLSKARRHDPVQRKIDGRELSIGDILVNSTGVGTLGRVAQVLSSDELMIVDSHVTVVRASENLTWNYLGLSMMRRQVEIERLGEGSTGQTELNRSKLAALKLIIPPKETLLAFDEIALPLRQRFAVNLKQAQTLATLRDTLLPRLISGQLRLPDAEALAEEAGA